MSTSPSRSWHVDSWPTLALLETLLKLAALVIGIVAGVRAVITPDFQLAQGWQLTQFIILLLLSLGLLAAIGDRWTDKEIVAMVFVVINNLGHWGMLVTLVVVPWPANTLLLFAGLMLLGDLVKLLFIRVHQFTVRAYPSSLLIGLTLFYVVGYLLIIVIELLR